MKVKKWVRLVLFRSYMACIGGLAVLIGAHLKWVVPDRVRSLVLGRAATRFLEKGKLDKAERYARELLSLAERFEDDDWNDGTAHHKGNLVLGRLALRSGAIEDAKAYLLRAGETPGGPALGSFGPNMSLAKELLEQGEREVVLDYFDLCARFWRIDYGRKALAYWRQVVISGKIPDFRANLHY